MSANPFFNYLPLKPTKGEALFVNYPFEFPKIIKNKTAFVPIGKNEYWIGGTNDWNDQNNEPTLEKQTLMQQEWHELLDPNLLSIQNHRAAIRPATKDRFPFLGKHPEHPNLFIFNGFGTKATLLTPYLSNHFVDFLTKNTSLMQEVNCNRFN
jgi:glycine/D-amino acid oxidase-like deaminating enzyme